MIGGIKLRVFRRGFLGVESLGCAGDWFIYIPVCFLLFILPMHDDQRSMNCYL